MQIIQSVIAAVGGGLHRLCEMFYIRLMKSGRHPYQEQL